MLTRRRLGHPDPAANPPDAAPLGTPAWNWDVDPVTADMVTAILRDEEGHRRLFEGFLRELEADGLA